MNNILKYSLCGMAIIGLGIVIYLGNKTFTPYEDRLRDAEANLIAKSDDIKQKLVEIAPKTSVIIKNGTLPGDILAQTTVSDDISTIIVDVNKVTKTKDRLEPVLGHELYHVWEAYLSTVG